MDLIRALYCIKTFNAPQCRAAFSPGLLCFAHTLACHSSSYHHHCTLCSTLQDLSLFHNYAFVHTIPAGTNVHPSPVCSLVELQLVKVILYLYFVYHYYGAYQHCVLVSYVCLSLSI